MDEGGTAMTMAQRNPSPSALEKRIQAGETDPISDAERASAARIRIMVDKKRGRKTEGWIKKLATSA
ncbi:hypothetical protein FGG90_12980 [Clavibacter tessellarius]|uniref:Uncharacterized protein n=2 Tax=Clavibacter tessellarius TaxID=31965 RepID=A0A225CIF7_9MICO|nr:hypothetical protein B5P24_03720 [Clavibacter michiganensis subsp. tessellarius]UKF34812.1 hypothetical protein FGG90_12980 [Clavibacter michiganensis subsp. tessellarius]